MKKKLLLVCVALLSLLGATAQVPVNSTTNGSDVWYYIKAQRGGTGGNYATAATGAARVTHEAIAYTDAQQWKVVTLGSGVALVNKAYGTYMNADAGTGNVGTLASPSVPTKALTIALSAATANIGQGMCTVEATSFRLHAGGSPSGWFNYSSDLNDNCSYWFLPAATVTSAKKEAIYQVYNNAKILKATAVQGTAEGQYPAQAFTDLQTVIDAQQAVYENASATDAEIDAAIAALSQGTAIFKSTVVFPFTMSTAANPVWYYIEGAGTAPTYGSLNKAIGVDIISFKCLWASPNASPAYQLFRFEQLPNTSTFKIVNMLFPDGGLLSTSSPIVCGTNSAAFWSVNKLTGASGDQYQLSTSTGVMLHLAESGTYVVDYTAGYNSASALKFVAATPTEVTQATNTLLANPLALANSLQTASPAGNNPGQYPSADKATFQQTIDAVALVNANGSATEAERLTALNSLLSAISVFNTKLVLTSASKWYYIVSANSAAYSSGKVMVDNATANNKINWTTEAIDTKQAWAFEPATGGKYKIKNNASGKYITSPTDWSNSLMAVSGHDYALTSLTQAQFNITGPKQPLHAASSGSEVVCWTGGMSTASAWKIKEIIPVSQTITFADITAKQIGDADFSLGATTDATGVTLTYASSDEGIATVSAAGLVHITATAAGTTNITVTQSGNIFYNAATPVMKVLTVGGPNGLKDVEGQVTVTTKNRMLVITGTTAKAQAFTVAGAQVDASKALNPGIYVVKVAGKTLKVNVQ